MYSPRRTLRGAILVDAARASGARSVGFHVDTYRRIAARGKTAKAHRGVSPADLITAACAEIHGATPVHYDGDDERIGKVTGQPMRWLVPAGSVD